MKKLILLLLPLFASAQTYFPMREGATLEYKYYDDKGRALKDDWRKERWTRLTVDKMWGDSVANVAVEDGVLVQLAKDKLWEPAVESLGYGDVRQTATGTTMDNVQLLMPFPALLINNFKGGPEGGRLGVEISNSSTLPRELNVGDTLPEEHYRWTYQTFFDSSLSAEEREQYEQMVREEQDNAAGQIEELGLKSKTSSTYTLTSSIVVRGRVVEGRETVQTPAGEFECWKITYEMVGPSERLLGFPTYEEVIDAIVSAGGTPDNINGYIGPSNGVITKYVDYIAPSVGLVRREKLSDTGRRVKEVTVLEKLK